MTNITLDSLPAKTGIVSNAGIVHYRESGVDKKLTISDLIAKFLEENPKLSSIEDLSSISNLLSLANLTGASNKLPYFTGAGAMDVRDLLATNAHQGIVYLNNPIKASNNALDPNNDIDFSAGNFIFSDGTGQALATAMTKRLDAAWSAGTNQGGLLNGAAVPKAINSTYHWYAIYNPVTGVGDYGAILGVAGTPPDPTAFLPNGYTKFSKNPIFSSLTDGSGNIRTGIALYKSDGNYYFFYNVPVVDITGAVTITTERLQSVSVPLGLNYLSSNAAYVNVAPGSTGNNFSIGISNYNATTNRSFVAMATKNPTFIDDSGVKPQPILTNTSGQLYFFSFSSGNLSTHALTTEAWRTLY